MQSVRSLRYPSDVLGQVCTHKSSNVSHAARSRIISSILLLLLLLSHCSARCSNSIAYRVDCYTNYPSACRTLPLWKIRERRGIATASECSQASSPKAVACAHIHILSDPRRAQSCHSVHSRTHRRTSLHPLSKQGALPKY